MPELPEVECVRRGLVRARLNQPVVSVWRSKYALKVGKAWAREREHVRRLVGATPGRIGRRGKFVVWTMMRAGETPLGLLIHLGMTGRCEIAQRGVKRSAHTHLVVRFSDDRELRYVDARRFGGLRVDTLPALRGAPPLSTLGPEPLGRRFDGDALAGRAGHRTRALRDVLLDQTVVAGIGNIYANEALFLARLHPLLPARRLGPTAWDRLAEAVRDVLRQGIDNGGTTLRDYRNADGERGRNAAALWVYGRAGAPCRQCGSELVGFVHGGRSGVFCPEHQRRPRARVVR